jgi:hypothetical protein
LSLLTIVQKVVFQLERRIAAGFLVCFASGTDSNTPKQLLSNTEPFVTQSNAVRENMGLLLRKFLAVLLF